MELIREVTAGNPYIYDRLVISYNYANIYNIILKINALQTTTPAPRNTTGAPRIITAAPENTTSVPYTACCDVRWARYVDAEVPVWTDSLLQTCIDNCKSFGESNNIDECKNDNYCLKMCHRASCWTNGTTPQIPQT